MILSQQRQRHSSRWKRVNNSQRRLIEGGDGENDKQPRSKSLSPPPRRNTQQQRDEHRQQLLSTMFPKFKDMISQSTLDTVDTSMSSSEKGGDEILKGSPSKKDILRLAQQKQPNNLLGIVSRSLSSSPVPETDNNIQERPTSAKSLSPPRTRRLGEEEASHSANDCYSLKAPIRRNMNRAEDNGNSEDDITAITNDDDDDDDDDVTRLLDDDESSYCLENDADLSVGGDFIQDDDNEQDSQTAATTMNQLFEQTQQALYSSQQRTKQQRTLIRNLQQEIQQLQLKCGELQQRKDLLLQQEERMQQRHSIIMARMHNGQSEQQEQQQQQES